MNSTAASTSEVQKLPELERAIGTAKIEFKLREHKTVLAELYQKGSAKIRLPRPEPDKLLEAVLINTSGGLTDHDIFSVNAAWQPGTKAVITSQAAERIYKSRSAYANIKTVLNVGEKACAFWLPQETILFNDGKFKRDCKVNIVKHGQLLACESMVFGRAAMGEIVQYGALSENWDIYYDNSLIFADRMKLSGDISTQLNVKTIANGYNAWATILFVSENAQDYQKKIRELSEFEGSLFATSLRKNILVVRVLGQTGAHMRFMLTRILEAFVSGLLSGNIETNNTEYAPVDHTKQVLPRVWYC